MPQEDLGPVGLKYIVLGTIVISSFIDDGVEQLLPLAFLRVLAEKTKDPVLNSGIKEGVIVSNALIFCLGEMLQTGEQRLLIVLIFWFCENDGDGFSDLVPGCLVFADDLLPDTKELDQLVVISDELIRVY